MGLYSLLEPAYYKMHKKHRHHKDSKHASKSKKHHKSGHKIQKSHDVRENQHVSFKNAIESSEVNKNSCGDFGYKLISEDKHAAKHNERPKLNKTDKQQDVKKYLRELTNPQPEKIITHISLDRKTFGDTVPEPTGNVEGRKQVELSFKSRNNSIENMDRKHKHRHHRGSKNGSKERNHHKEKHENGKVSSERHGEPKAHKHNTPDNHSENKYQGTVQEVLFYQVAPYSIKYEKPQNEIKDLYHRNNKAKSKERRVEKKNEHRDRSTTTVRENHRHKIEKEDRERDRVKSIEKERLPSKAKDEKIHQKETQKSKEKELLKDELKHFKRRPRDKSKDHEGETIVSNKIKEAKENKERRKPKEPVTSTANQGVSFQEKVENDMKHYFNKIQTIIDKKFESILKNSKMEINDFQKNSDVGHKAPKIIVKKVRRPKSEKRDSKSVEFNDRLAKTKVKLANKDRPEIFPNKENKNEPNRRHKINETFNDGELQYIHKKRGTRVPKGESENKMETKHQKNISGLEPQKDSFIPGDSQGVAKMTSDQSQFTNYYFRHPEPSNEWTFPPELWNLKIHDLILASQNKQFFKLLENPKTTSADRLRQRCPSSTNYTLPHLAVFDQNHEEHSSKPDFVVHGIEPPSLDPSTSQNSKKKELDKKLECKTVSVIDIKPKTHVRELKNTNESATQNTPNSASDDLVEKRKKSKRFKIYYKYSVEDNLQRQNDVACSSDGKSVVSDSFKVVNDLTEDRCQDPQPISKKRKILEHQLVQNIYIKPQEKIPKNRKMSTPILSALNNIAEEPTNISETSVNQCYFKGLSTSNSESCLKINKKPDSSSISVNFKPPTKKVCKYCKHHLRSKSDVKVTLRGISKFYKCKSSVVSNTSDARQVVKSILLADGDPFVNSRISVERLQKVNGRVQTEKIITSKKEYVNLTDQECQTSDYKVTEEEEMQEKKAYEDKKKQFKEIYKTLDHLESGIQTVSQKYSSKNAYVDTSTGSEIFQKYKKEQLENMLQKEVPSEKPTFNIPEKKKVKPKVKVKDIAIGVSDDDVEESQLLSPIIELKSTGCSPICIRGPKSPTKTQTKTPAVNQRRTSRNADTSPPKPVPRQSVLSRSVPLRKSVIPPAHVIVLHNSKANCAVRKQEPEQGHTERQTATKTKKVHPELIPKNTPRCNRGREVSRPRSVRHPLNVEELLRDDIEEQTRTEAKEKMRVETFVKAEDKIRENTKPLRTKIEECRPLPKRPASRQTRPPTCVIPSVPRATPVIRQKTEHKVNETKQKKLISKKKSHIATPDGCLHIFSPRDKPEDDNIQKRPVSVNRAEVECRNPGSATKRISGSTSSSVSDTAIQKTQKENEDQQLKHSKSLMDIETYIKNTVAAQEPQIYSHTEAYLLTAQQIETKLKKFITEPQSRWCRAKSNVPSLDQYDEKCKCTMLLTKQDKVEGPSSYEKRKNYDAALRQKNKDTQQVFLVNDLGNQQQLCMYDEHESIILQNPSFSLGPKIFRKTPQDSALGSTIENFESLTPKTDLNENKPENPSIMTLFAKKYDKNDKLYNFCQKLLAKSSSLEFSFKESCSCKEISKDCEACNDFIQNLAVLFIELSLQHHHKDDIPEFVNHFSTVTVNLDNEVCEFYNNEDFNAESLVGVDSIKSDDHDSVTAKIFYPDDIHQEVNNKICEELFPGGFTKTIMSKFVRDSNQCKEFLSSSGQFKSVTHPVSCPVLQDNKTNFEYLYDEKDSSSTSRESKENVFSSLTTPHAFNINLTQYNMGTTPFFENIGESIDTSESSGYESVESKSKSKTVSHTNFFKKPNIAALFKPHSLTKKKLDLTKHPERSSLEWKNNINEQMMKNCQTYARKIRDYKDSKGNFFEEFKELPLNILLNQNNAFIFENQSLHSNSCDNKKKTHNKEITIFDESEQLCINKNKSKDILPQQTKETPLEAKKDTVLTESNHSLFENTETFGENNPFIEENQKALEEDFSSKNGCKIVLSNHVLKVESVSYFVPEIFLEPEHLKNEECNNIENCLDEVYLADLTEIIPTRASFDQIIAKKFFDSLLNAYDVESEICNIIYEDQDFLSKYMLPALKKRKLKGKKCKKKGFSCLFRKKSSGNSDVTEEMINLKVTPNEHQLRLQELSSNARRCFSMLADAVKKNINIDDNQIKICGILKMLERIENGDFQIMQQKEAHSNIEETVKNQVIDSFVNIYEICQKEAKNHKRNLGDTELDLIKTFVTKFRPGLLSKTDIVAAYIGRGQIQSESQLKAAVTLLMSSNSEEINPKEFEEYCKIIHNANKSFNK